MNNNIYTFYLYDVTWYDEYNEEQSWKEIRTKGLICADSIADVAARVETSFDSIDRMEIKAINDDELLDLEDLLYFLNPDANRGSALGPQLIAALQEAIEVENAELEDHD